MKYSNIAYSVVAFILITLIISGYGLDKESTSSSYGEDPEINMCNQLAQDAHLAIENSLEPSVQTWLDNKYLADVGFMVKGESYLDVREKIDKLYHVELGARFVNSENYSEYERDLGMVRKWKVEKDGLQCEVGLIYINQHPKAMISLVFGHNALF